MEIKIVAQGSGGYYRVLLMKGGKLDKRVMDFPVDDGALFNPSDLVLLGFDLEEAAAMLEHFEGLAVHHLGHAIGDGGYTVMDEDLARGDVNRLRLLTVEMLACRAKHKNAQTEYR
jgi:hypothetical protein